MSRFIEIPDDGIIRIPIIEDGVKVGEQCIDLSDLNIVDAKPVVRGEWLKELYEPYRCSICGKWELTEENFCSECGADMRGEKNE